MLKKLIGAVLAVVIPASGHAGMAGAGVLQHHNDAARSGHYIVPRLTAARAARLHRDPKFDGRVPGAINAQPLYWQAPSGRALLIVATEDDVVTALDARTGKPAWQRRLGSPVPGSDLPCGNISPLGITGTPIIDRARKAVYVDAMVLAKGEPRHRVFALSLADGSTLPGWPVDVQELLTGARQPFRARVQNQRGALAITDGMLYVPFGGHFGDCGDYHGWVVGLPLDRPRAVSSFATRARGGGIWAPGGIAIAGGALFVATGNTFGARHWQDGEAVLRLPSDLQFTKRPQDFFTPNDWRELDARDLDLGGSSPLPLRVPGGQPTRLVLALGKDGKAYLLDRANLGGVGGALRVAQVARSAIRTAATVYVGRSGVFAVFQGEPVGCPHGQHGDIAALHVRAGSPPSLQIAWCASAHGRGSPIVTTTAKGQDAIVWMVGAEGDNRLHAFNGQTGQVIFDGHGTDMGFVAHFQTPIVAAGRIYVAARGRVYAFVF